MRSGADQFCEILLERSNSTVEVAIVSSSLYKTRMESWLDARHCRKCGVHNVAYVDPNMESIFKCNNLRFSPEMFCHISVIKDDCCVVAYGCFFLPEHLQVSGGGNRKSSTLFTADAATILFECVPSLAFPHFVFSLNKFVHSDAQFHRTNDCWWLFELNSSKVCACKCSLNA